MKRCAQCYGKLGLGVRSRNVWNGRWWVHERFCSAHCERHFPRTNAHSTTGTHMRKVIYTAVLAFAAVFGMVHAGQSLSATTGLGDGAAQNYDAVDPAEAQKAREVASRRLMMSMRKRSLQERELSPM
jgi:hypothetical protein